MSTPEAQITVLFADISHSTGLYERLGDNIAREYISRALELMSREVLSTGGRVVKSIGDEIMCTFSTPAQGAEAAQKMQDAVFRDTVLNAQNVSVRIGLHCGEAIFEQNDYYGDAVNVAARATDIAKADQIILTMDVANELPEYLRMHLRNIGRLRVEGKTVDLDFFELNWRGDEDTLTIMVGSPEHIKPSPKTSRLFLYSQGNSWEITTTDPPLQLGRDDRNNLVLTTPYTSRRHASIRFVNGRFLLKDFSINGTYLYPESTDMIFLLREEAPLDSKGVISFGQDVNEEGAIAFEYELINE